MLVGELFNALLELWSIKGMRICIWRGMWLWTAKNTAEEKKKMASFVMHCAQFVGWPQSPAKQCCITHHFYLQHAQELEWSKMYILHFQLEIILFSNKSLTTSRLASLSGTAPILQERKLSPRSKNDLGTDTTRRWHEDSHAPPPKPRLLLRTSVEHVAWKIPWSILLIKNLGLRFSVVIV